MLIIHEISRSLYILRAMCLPIRTTNDTFMHGSGTLPTR